MGMAGRCSPPARPTRETRPPTPASASGRPPHGVEPAPSSGPRAERLVASSRQPAPAGPASLRTGCSFSISTSLVESSCRSGRSSSPDRPTPTATATNAAAATEAARHAATCWRSGIEAGCRALLSAGATADGLYREVIERLGHTRLRPELAWRICLTHVRDWLGFGPSRRWHRRYSHASRARVQTGRGPCPLLRWSRWRTGSLTADACSITWRRRRV